MPVKAAVFIPNNSYQLISSKTLSELRSIYLEPIALRDIALQLLKYRTCKCDMFYQLSIQDLLRSIFGSFLCEVFDLTQQLLNFSLNSLNTNQGLASLSVVARRSSKFSSGADGRHDSVIFYQRFFFDLYFSRLAEYLTGFTYRKEFVIDV